VTGKARAPKGRKARAAEAARKAAKRVRRPRARAEGVREGARVLTALQPKAPAEAAPAPQEGALRRVRVGRRGGESRTTCPVCGKPGWLERRERASPRGVRVYYYVVHSEKTDQGRVLFRHYLGPETYIFGPLRLQAAMSPRYFLEYAKGLLEKMTPSELLELREEIDRRLSAPQTALGPEGEGGNA
jgi:hypothetical protein